MGVARVMDGCGVRRADAEDADYAEDAETANGNCKRQLQRQLQTATANGNRKRQPQTATANGNGERQLQQHLATATAFETATTTMTAHVTA